MVGAHDVEIEGDRVVIGGRALAGGARLTIDGDTGEVFEGNVAGSWTVVPEAATLLQWAEDLGIDLPRSSRNGPHATEDPDGAVLVSPSELWAVEPHRDDLLQALLVKGMSGRDHIASALRL